MFERIYSPRMLSMLYQQEPIYGQLPLWHKDASKWKGGKVVDGWVIIPAPKKETIMQWLLRKVKL